MVHFLSTSNGFRDNILISIQITKRIKEQGKCGTFGHIHIKLVRTSMWLIKPDIFLFCYSHEKWFIISNAFKSNEFDILCVKLVPPFRISDVKMDGVGMYTSIPNQNRQDRSFVYLAALNKVEKGGKLIRNGFSGDYISFCICTISLLCWWNRVKAWKVKLNGFIPGHSGIIHSSTLMRLCYDLNLTIWFPLLQREL